MTTTDKIFCGDCMGFHDASHIGARFASSLRERRAIHRR